MLENDCHVRVGSFGSVHFEEEGALVRRIDEVLVDIEFRLPGSSGIVDDIDRWKQQHNADDEIIIVNLFCGSISETDHTSY